MVINSVSEDDDEEPKMRWEETLAGHCVLQLKGNVNPRGLVPLERLFDKNDIPVNPNKLTLNELVRDVNIGTEEDPKVVKLSKGVPEEYQGHYLSLFQSYKYIFAWSYQDLKTFDVEIKHHKIPLKEDVKPHRKNLK